MPKVVERGWHGRICADSWVYLLSCVVDGQPYAPLAWVAFFVSLPPFLSLSLAPQSGDYGYDYFEAVAVNQTDGSIVLAGEFDDSYSLDDFGVVKLDADGLLVWTYQVRFRQQSRPIAIEVLGRILRAEETSPT